MISTRRAQVAMVLLVTAGCRGPRPSASPPPTTPPAPIARLSAIKGGVQVRASGTLRWILARSEMDLNAGDLVRTVAGAGAEISFPDGFVLKMKPDSLLAVEATPGLRIGGLTFAAQQKRPERPPSLSAPMFRWRDSPEASEPPAGVMSVEQSGQGRIEQHRGRGEVATQRGQRLELAANEQVTVDAGGQAGAKVLAPPAPVILAPAHQSTLTYEVPARTTTVLAWAPVPGAARYHVVVGADAWFSEPLHDRADSAGAAFQLKGVPPGKYYWHVASIDERGTEGAFSDFASFTIATLAVAEVPRDLKLVIESIEIQRNVLRIKGSTEPGATVTVNGQELDVMEDGSFLEYITLPDAGPQKLTIRAEAPRGRATTIEKIVSDTSS